MKRSKETHKKNPQKMATALYRMNFNATGPIDPNLFKMCEEADAYYQMECLIAEMSRVKMEEPIENLFANLSIHTEPMEVM